MRTEAHYPITGRLSGRVWLVEVRPWESWLYPPDAFDADTFAHVGRGLRISGSPRIAGWLIRRRIAHSERRVQRIFRRFARAAAYAASQRAREDR